MTRQSLQNDLRKMGIKLGDTLLVHSSMKAICTTMPPEEILSVLQGTVGEYGTLLFPALTYDNVTPEHPVFETCKTEPCIGLLPRTFMCMQGVVRSKHPTHSVCAWGHSAEELTKYHDKDRTPVGPNSPFIKLMEHDGRILFIGDILDSCTFMHGVEEKFGTDYVLTKNKVRYIVDGEERYYYAHDFSGWGAEFWRIKNILPKKDLVQGKFGEATCYLIDPKILMKKATEELQKDLHYFVTDISMFM